jgi:Class III cytochrome C family
MRRTHLCTGRRERGALIAAALALFTLRLAAADPASANGEEPRCLACHGLANLAARDDASGVVRDFSVPAAAFASSVHGRLTCGQCHEDVRGFPHRFAGARSKVTCDKDCHARDGEGRPYSHRAEALDFSISVHRPRDDGRQPDRPTCLTCHGGGNAHAIVRAATVTPRERLARCASCHDDGPMMARNDVEPDAVRSYARSFHYKAVTFGAARAAVCPDCHTAHRVLPPSDPRASIHAAALPATCGQTSCHTGARTNFAISGANHLDLRIRRESVLFVEEKLFELLTAGTMAMLVVGIVLDVQKKIGFAVIASAAMLRLRRTAARAFGGGRRAVRVVRWLLVE